MKLNLSKNNSNLINELIKSDTNNNTLKSDNQLTKGPIDMSNSSYGDEEEDESLVITSDSCDECDTNGHQNTKQQQERQTNREELRKQFVDVFHLATNASSHCSPLSSCSMSSSCCSPSRMSSPSPTCGTPTQPHSPSTLSSIREAVSHLTRLDDFNVIKLSQGFFSQVFKVTHHSTKKVMVLKMNKQAGNRGNALKEIELLNKLNHENIVAYMGTVVHEGGLHPLLEYINGGTLEKLIRQYYKIDTYFDENKQLITRNGDHISHNYHNNNHNYNYCPQIYQLSDTTQNFIKLAEDISRGMDYLHSLHYLHRDLTSKNVFIRKLPPIENSDCNEPQLVAVIGDFGFAAIEPTIDHKLPTVGSPYWLAPECIKGQWYNHKCDIYSFGVICCELNWRIPADPDYLPRDDNFLINFDKLMPPKDTLLSRIAQLACQRNASIRPEFSEILEIFETELDRNSSHNKCIFRRDLSHSNSSIDSSHAINSGCGDIFDQHLIRRRNSQIEKKYSNGSNR